MSKMHNTLTTLVNSDSYATWKRSAVVAHVMKKFTIADKRYIFGIMRKVNMADLTNGHLLYLPRFGITLGQFALMHMLGESTRRTKSSAKRSERECKGNSNGDEGVPV